MENNYTVYMHIFPNNKVYIGITNKNVNSRWRKNGVGYTNCPRMNNAINKYGWENVEHKILYEYLTKEEAEQKEIELIAQYKSNYREFGYNIANGGMHKGKCSEETKKKIRNSGASKTFFKKGETSWNKGIPQSSEAKEKNRIAHIGKKQSQETKLKRSKSLKGHRMSEETKLKIKQTKQEHYPNGYRHSIETINKIQENRSKIRSDEAKHKQSNTMREKYKNGYISPMIGRKAINRKPIIQLDLNDNFIREWDCISDASKYYGINSSRICLVLKKKRNQTAGYKWIYKNEYNVTNAILGGV
ncbi:MAG: GIY-YIG nuclease family protein [Candidatus Gastranaerophilales bacterium]|nr:GIY-YIG nuclease family protein [Candidatus Gastranaerophilales bacterium]